MGKTAIIIAIMLGGVLLFAVPIFINHIAITDQDQLPADWANFFTEDDYKEFIGYVKSYFADQSLKITIEDGVLMVKGEGHYYHDALGLTNIAQECYYAPRSEWKEMIWRHFNNLKEAAIFDKKLKEVMGDYDKIVDYLTVRIWAEDIVPPNSLKNFIYRRDLQGTLTTLVYDLPSSVRNVTVEEAAMWGKSQEELFHVALANVLEKYPPNVSTIDVTDLIQLYCIETDEYYATTYALLLHHYPELVGKYGSIVSIPNRNILIVYPINNTDVYQVMKTIVFATDRIFKDGPGSITPYVYWYHEERYTNIPYEFDVLGGIRIYMPENFLTKE